MPLERVQLSDFVVDKAGGRGFSRFQNRTHGKRGKHGVQFGAGSMFVKLGICAFMCALVLLLSALQNGANDAVGASYTADSSTDDEFDETLGKLKFVELPGILEVFAAQDKIALAVNYDAAELLADDTMLMLVSAAAQTVSLPVDGRVKAIGEDDKLGGYVCITSANDSEIQYYGLSSISVEEGQSLKALDSLGVIEAGESLFIKVNVSGRPENPTQFFEVGEDGI
ncbi:MAG TPA: M23 family metallopeptidase [Clostridia bacterium]|jgi:hypothetical protein|nr:M23 family metallopeptidase [Clostridia bacterium]